MTLEELSRDARVTGIVPDGPVTILDVRRRGEDAAEVTYRTADGRVDHALLFRHQEPELTLVPRGDAWTFDADGKLFRLAAEALRIRNAHLGYRRKLIVFTEHRDTLDDLAARLRNLLGRPEAVVTIRGGMRRQDRRQVQEAFMQDKAVLVLVATDAAGEGINLQRAHLMVNYDLPWNPSRLEQRFGRIHRIGQTEVCHCWNLLAEGTREGDVYLRLLRKLEVVRQALGDKVFDVLGHPGYFEKPLRELLIDAIRYGDDPRVKAQLEEKMDMTADLERIERLLADEQLAHDALDDTRIRKIRADMERAAARRLQPHFVSLFFLAALEHLGGRYYVREPRRYEVTRVPREVRVRDRLQGPAGPLLERYERVTFHKELIAVAGRPVAEFVAPGHPLLDAVVGATLERTRDVLRRGAVLVDNADPGTDVRLMACLEHAIRDARTGAAGEPRIVSRRLQFVELDAAGALRAAGPAPYLDYDPAEDHERALLADALAADWLRDETLEERCTSFAVATLAPEHLAEVRGRTLERIAKTERAVRERLTAEITHWDRRAEELRAQEQAGKQPRMNWQNARRRVDELQRRLDERLAQLQRERSLAALPPRIIGGAVIVPRGLLHRLAPSATPPPPAVDRDVIERRAGDAVLAVEEALGRHPREMPPNHPGFDVESLDPETGRLYFIEVKGHGGGSDTVPADRRKKSAGTACSTRNPLADASRGLRFLSAFRYSE